MITESKSAGIRNKVESNISKIKWHCQRSCVGKGQGKQYIIGNGKIKVDEKMQQEVGNALQRDAKKRITQVHSKNVFGKMLRQQKETDGSTAKFLEHFASNRLVENAKH